MAFCFTTSVNVFANQEVDVLTSTPPSLIQDSTIGIYGAKPPKSSADVHDLSKSKYLYQVEDMDIEFIPVNG